MAESESYVREGNSAFLVHPEYQGAVTEEWFDPEYWGRQATPVDRGGRGGAWFLHAASGPLVLRHYRRGGLVARFVESSYVYRSEEKVRSFAEFRLLARLVQLGFPVPRPVAAWYRKTSPKQYRAAIIIERIEAAKPLADLIDTLSPGGWEVLGQVIKNFHDAGVRHADLNCFNVLVSQGNFYLIDFDKGKIVGANESSGWKNSNLRRFARSLHKVAGVEAQDITWRSFMKGYNGSQPVE